MVMKNRDRGGFGSRLKRKKIENRQRKEERKKRGGRERR